MKIMFIKLFYFHSLSLSDCNKFIAFEQLLEVDKELSSFSERLIDIIHEHGLDDMQKNFLRNLVVVGSAHEGSITSRVFQPSPDKDKLNKELDVDLEYNAIALPATDKELVEDVPGKAGFVKIRSHKNVIRLANLGWEIEPKDLKSFLTKISKNGYIKPNRIKEEICKKIKLQNREDEIKIILAAALDLEFGQITLNNIPKDDPSTLINTFIDILVDNQLELTISWNLVPVIKLDWWPEVAKEWTNRKRQWPSKSIISELTSHSYIAANISNGNKAAPELQYSFTNIERELSKLRTRKQSLVYLIFKSLIYKWIKPVSNKQFGSYIAKTIMLWACEKFPPSHHIWAETSTIQTLTYLFDEMLTAVKKDKLPNYFIPEVNEIKNMDSETRKRIILQIESIISNVEEAIPTNVVEATVESQKMLKMVKEIDQVMKDVKDEYYDIFIKRPDLIPKALEIFGSKLLSLGYEKRKDINKHIDDVKDHINDKWSKFQEDVNMEDVKKNVKETIDQVKEQLNLEELEKKAKDFMRKFEL